METDRIEQGPLILKEQPASYSPADSEAGEGERVHSRIQFIQHRNRDILLLDFSNSQTDEVMRIINAAKKVISSRPQSSLLTLTDVTNARFNDEVRDGLKEFALHNKPYVKAGAVVGITGLKRIIFGAVMAFSGRKMESFDDREQAKQWLVDN